MIRTNVKFIKFGLAVAMTLGIHVVMIGFPSYEVYASTATEPTISTGTNESNKTARTRSEFIEWHRSTRSLPEMIHFESRVYTTAEFFDAYNGLSFRHGVVNTRNNRGVQALNVTLSEGRVSPSREIQVAAPPQTEQHQGVQPPQIPYIPQQTQPDVPPSDNTMRLLTNEELESLVAIAPSSVDTRSATTLPTRRLTDTELNAWIEEYHLLGGINAFEYEVVRLINEVRASYGLQPWAIDYRLMMAARFHSQEMNDLSYFNHRS